MPIRTAETRDIDSIEAIERLCFPLNEAATRASLTERIQVFHDHFWLYEENRQVLGFINGMVTNYPTIQDEMFLSAQLHNPGGNWQSVFGLAVLPDHRKKGYAAQLIRHLIARASSEARTGVTLTCKQHLIAYYTKFGFKDAGISASLHGGAGAQWHDLILLF